MPIDSICRSKNLISSDIERKKNRLDAMYLTCLKAEESWPIWLICPITPLADFTEKQAVANISYKVRRRGGLVEGVWASQAD